MRYYDEFEYELNQVVYEVHVTVNAYYDAEFDRDWKEVEHLKVFDSNGDEIEDSEILDEISEHVLDREVLELHTNEFDYVEEIDYLFKREA